MAEVIVGIDLGTTNSLVAVFDGGGARSREGRGGERLLPSVVRYEEVTTEITESAERRTGEEESGAGAEAGGVGGRGAHSESPGIPSVGSVNSVVKTPRVVAI